MGRKIPSANNDFSQAFHQTLSVPVLLAAMAAVMAIISLICGARSRRKPDSPPPAHKQTENNTKSPFSPPQQTPIESHKEAEKAEKSAAIEVVIESGSDLESQRRTAGKQLIKDTFSSTNLLKKSASTRNLARNLSVKMQRSMSMAGRDLQDRMKNRGKLKPEESVWMKTIILGGKCRVEDGEEAIIYERKGNKISAYHPKTSNSPIDHNVIRSQDPRNGKSRDFLE